MHLSRSGGKSFSSAALWNSLYPISCFISFIFRSRLIPMANFSFPLLFQSLQANFLHCACTYSPSATGCRGRGFSFHLLPSWETTLAWSWTQGEPSWPPVWVLSVALEPLALLSWSSCYLCTISSTDFLNGKMFSSAWDKKMLSWCHSSVWVLCEHWSVEELWSLVIRE